MVRLTLLLSQLAIAALSVAASIPRQAPTPAVTTIFRFPNGTFAENLAVRPNGKILVTLMTTAELWEVDPETKNGSRLFKFPMSSASGITEYAPDLYAVLVGSSGPSGSWGVWKVDMTVAPPKIASFMNGTNWGTVNGMTTLNIDTVLVADAGKGAIHSVNMTSGISATVINDTEVLGAPPGAAFAFGVDGIRIFNGSLFFTNIQKETFGKVSFYTCKCRFECRLTEYRLRSTQQVMLGSRPRSCNPSYWLTTLLSDQTELFTLEQVETVS
jgi:hypothetical protein